MLVVPLLIRMPLLVFSCLLAPWDTLDIKELPEGRAPWLTLFDDPP